MYLIIMTPKISMVDLVGQYQKIKPEVDAAITQVISSAQFINGSVVAAFEKQLAEFLKVNHVIACGSGTDALQVALMALDLQPGDEVITSTFSFVATAEVIALLGLKPVFVDISEQDYCLDVGQLEQAITHKTKAIIPVHLFGQSVNIDKIRTILFKQNFKIAIVEDTAQALGAQCLVDGEWSYAGTIGDFGCTSFFPSKNLGAFGDGGALFTNNADLAEKARMIVNHGSKKKYHHEIVGVNSRLDSIQAAVLQVKLNYLSIYNLARAEAASFYDEALGDIKGIVIPKTNTYSTHIFHQYTIRVYGGKRDELKDYLAVHSIPSMVYYPVSLHLQKAFLESNVNELPVAVKLSDEVLSLPMHTELKLEQLEEIVSKIQIFFNS